MCVAILINVVKAKELLLVFTTTRAFIAIVNEDGQTD